MLKYYCLLLISILLNCSSLILLKKGILIGHNYINALNKLSSWIHLLTNGYILLSIFIFGAGAIIWMLSLTKFDLSPAYPASSISYVVIAIASYYLFGETIPFHRWLGIGIIIFGVIVMFQK
jgi:multidrug transporter EmrE-like cation transporter